MPTSKQDPGGKRAAKTNGDANKASKIAKENPPAGQDKLRVKSQNEEISGPPGPKVPFPVVGVGASAGGLKALEELLAHAPADLDFSLVVVLHEAPSAKSHLTDILARKSSLPVSQAKVGERPKAGQVHVCPPGKRLTLHDGSFEINPATPGDGPVTVDSLFHSLALEQEADCAAIVLSGSGSDGSRGALDVARAGGLVMAQDDQSAEYTDMPQATRATGVAAYVLPPEKMLPELAEYFEQTKRLVHEGKAAEREFLGAAAKIFDQVRQKTGHDFSAYKINTMRRRVERRMVLNQKNSLPSYLQFIREDENEAAQLFSELIIGVTSFFRDPEAWQVLKEQALLPRLDAVEPGHIFRAWVPGCSSGEEAYSLAILIEECREQAELDLEFQVFGTDISPMAVAKAREGRYPKSIATDLSLERLKRFFREKGGNLVVRKDIRDRLVFSEQDLLRDPPFSHLDLLVCRNLLIYLNAEAQQKLLPLFHYTLRPGGLLFLGSSESVGRFAKLFETVEQKAKIYRRREVPDYAKPGVLFPTGFHVFSSHEKGSGGQEKDRVNGGGGTVRYSQKLGEQTKKMLLSRFVPAAVAVDDRGEIIYVHGRTGKYLEPAQGPLSMNVVKMAREGLLPQLSLLLQRCAQDGTPQRVDGLKVRTNGHTQVVNLNVELLERGEEGLRLLVVFQDSADPVRKWTPPPKSATIQDQQIIKDLQQELQETRESHQGALEELEGANEELKSTNEELQSTNEELQSTNEELESSREELQSMNEELNTTNQEMRSKMDEMSKMQDDMANLINSTRIATLFLDNDLNIRRFTPEAAELINLIDSDVGRPVHDLVSKLDYPALASDIRKVLRTLEKSQSEVGAAGNGWFRVRIIPYRTTENVIDGAVVTFTDITELRAARNYAESIVATVREPLLVLDRDLGVVSANRSFYDFFKTRPGETEGRLVYELGNGQWDIPRLRELLERIIPQQSSFEGLEVEHEFPGIGAKRLVLNARRLERPGGEQELILLAMEASSQIGGKD